MPKISVIIPVYNVEKYLRECLDSVVNQTLKDIEIICVDDGSTDSSGRILDEYASKDDRIKVLHKENGGYGKAMNIGIDNATGEYIGIVEPDDFINLNMYETLYNIAIKNDVDFIKSDFYRFKGNKNNRELFYNKLSKNLHYYNKVFDVNQNLEAYSFIMNTWCGIYKREFIEKYHIRHNETPGASFQDNGFWFFTFAYSSRAYFLDKPFYMNRRDNPNSSIYNKSKIFNVCDEFKWIESKIREDNKLKNVLPLYFYMAYKAYQAGYSRLSPKFRMNYLKRFSHDFSKIVKDEQFDKSYFSEYQLKVLEEIIKDPSKYYREINNYNSFIESVFSVKNEDIRKVITILGIKFKFKSKKLIERKRLANLENVIYQINSDLQNKKNNITNLINKIDKQENDFASLINKIEEQENKIYNQIKIKNENKILSFRTIQNLSDLIRNKISMLPEDIDLVVGIPRSGVWCYSCLFNCFIFEQKSMYDKRIYQ